jgi:hypothetical protein
MNIMKTRGMIDHLRNEKHYLESRRREISYMNYLNGRLARLVTFCIETAFTAGY